MQSRFFVLNFVYDSVCFVSVFWCFLTGPSVCVVTVAFKVNPILSN